jgi:hypothetical protein
MLAVKARSFRLGGGRGIRMQHVMDVERGQPLLRERGVIR